MLNQKKKTFKYEDRSPENHIYGEWKCTMCLRYHVGEHFCYQRSQELPEIRETRSKFMFNDLELSWIDCLKSQLTIFQSYI